MEQIIKYIHEPTDLQCGQAVIAMLADVSPDEVCLFLGNDRETTLKEMKKALSHYGFVCADARVEVSEKSDLPDICILSLETPRCWHWSLYVKGTFYDPEHGISNDFPESKRKYCWKVGKLYPLES